MAPSKTWEALSELAQKAYNARIPACGLVDRILVQISKENSLRLWTLDGKLRTHAQFAKVQVFEES